MPSSRCFVSFNRVIGVFLAFAVVASMMISPPASTAAADAPLYDGLDLVVIIDQSGSMGGSAFGSSDHPKANDLNRLRFEAAQWIVQWLGDTRLNYVSTHPVGFRVGLVDFGDTVETRLVSTTIAPQSDEEWGPQLQQLKEQLSAERFGVRNLGNTNPLLGFQQAKQLFDQMKAMGDTGQRLRVIILVTDGLPYVLRQETPRAPVSTVGPNTPTPTPVPPRPVPLRTYMTEMIAYVNQNFPVPDYQVYVLGINDSDSDQWTPAATYWSELSHGNVKRVLNNATMGFELQEFMGRLAKQLGLREGEPIECGARMVPPYLRLIKFTLHKALETDSVQIKVNDKSLDLNDAARVKLSGAGSLIETIEVPNPEPGTWNIVCSTGGKLDPKIYEEQLIVEAALAEPSGLTFQFLPSQVKLKLSGYRGSDLPRYGEPKYQLAVEASIIRPSGAVTVPLSMVDQGTYTAPFTPTELGEYQIRVIAKTHNPDNTPLVLPLQLAPSDPATVLVSGTQPQLLSAPETTVLVPSRVSLQIQDDQGQRIEPEIFKKLVSQVQVTLEETGGARSFPMELQPDGTLAGEVTPLEAGQIPLSLAATGSDASRQFSQKLGSLQVGPLQGELIGLADAQAQYRTMNLGLRFSDRNGQLVVLNSDKAYMLDVTAVLSGPENATVVLTPIGDAVWSSPFRPQGAGDYSVHAVVKTGGAAVRTVFDGDVGTFRATPTTLVSLAITSPKNGAVLEYNKLLPFLHNPLEVLVELQSGGQRIDPASALLDAGRVPFTITLTEAPGLDRTAELSIEPAGQAGIWRVYSKSTSGRAAYQVQAVGKESLKPAYVWDETAGSVSFTRVPNRLLPLTYTLAALLLAALLYFLWRWVSNRFILPKARGTLHLEMPGDGTVGAPCDLESRRSHSVNWVPGAPQSGVKSVRITGLKTGVSVRVTYAKGGGATHTLTNGSRKPLPGGYWLIYRDARFGVSRGSEINW